ncbi:MAG: MBOAT family O-acyltransferase [Anaerolineales bacterium]
MSITQILLLVLIAILCGVVKHPRYRNTLLTLSSLLFYYHLQPATPIRSLDFWLPTFAILLGLLAWIAIQGNLRRGLKEGFSALLIVLLSVVAVSANRYLAICCLTATRPPQLGTVVLFLIVSLTLSALILSRFALRIRLTALILILVVIFISLKTPEISFLMSKFLRTLQAQDRRFSAADDLAWLGISYILFRLLHILLDIRTGRLQGANLTEIIPYLFFFPTLLAGPIVRFPQFREQLNAYPQTQDFVEGMRRIFIGLFRKFVLADSLALLALSPQNASQILSPTYLWIALLAYALRIYFDFSGYTDIAIGSARLVGIRLPENFNAPYLKTSLIQFWNSWHITLADWFRAYVFNPLTRKLRSSSTPEWLTILLPQLTTMLLIGLWHGITPNFLVWGAWHGMGLFINNRWNAWSRTRPIKIPLPIQNALTWTLTFGYVTLGWVWFLMPTFGSSLAVFQKLFGYG